MIWNIKIYTFIWRVEVIIVDDEEIIITIIQPVENIKHSMNIFNWFLLFWMESEFNLLLMNLIDCILKLMYCNINPGEERREKKLHEIR